MSKSNIKEKIISESIKLFSEKGFDGTSMRDIARKVQVTLPTIYYHFVNKEGLYKAVFYQVLDKLLTETSKSASGVKGIKEKLIAMGLAKHKFIHENREMMLIYLREFYNPNGLINIIDILTKGITLLESLIQNGIKNGEIRQIDPNLGSWFLLGVFNIFDLKIVSREELPSKEEIESVVDLAINGLKRK